jgi:uncharacterized membrane protein
LAQIKKEVKEKLTIQSAGGDVIRTHIQGSVSYVLFVAHRVADCLQVFANSGVASVLSLLHAYQLYQRGDEKSCYPWRGDLLVIGIVANYAAVAADTFSSELGILSKSEPRLVTSLRLRKVPRGTNGGVTLWGLLAGLLGSMVIVITALPFLQFCPITPIFGNEGSPSNISKVGWTIEERWHLSFGLVLWGALGSVLDSFLGGWLQQSVVDTRNGRIVEGEGGKKVLTSKEENAIPKRPGADHSEEKSDRKPGEDGRYDPAKKFRKPSFGDGAPTRVVETGLDILDNNQVNFLMALAMSVGAMAIAGWAWGVPLRTVIPL